VAIAMAVKPGVTNRSTYDPFVTLGGVGTPISTFGTSRGGPALPLLAHSGLITRRKPGRRTGMDSTERTIWAIAIATIFVIAWRSGR